MRDPDAPGKLLPAYDSGDFLRPSGRRLPRDAMGQAVDLALVD